MSGGTMENGVERDVGTAGKLDLMDVAPLRLQLLGELTVWVDGRVRPLPRSRKVRALLAYLAMAGRSVPRQRLCELLWSAAADPRGELRWSLSRARGVVDGGTGTTTLQTEGDTVRLAVSAAAVDARVLSSAAAAGWDAASTAELERVDSGPEGDFLAGLDIEREAAWTAWLLAQRRTLSAARAAATAALFERRPVQDHDALARIERWVLRSPLDPAAHETLLRALLLRGRREAAQQHLAQAVRRLADEAGASQAVRLTAAWRALDSAPGDAAGIDLGQARSGAVHTAVPAGGVAASGEIGDALPAPTNTMAGATGSRTDTGDTWSPGRRACVVVLPLKAAFAADSPARAGHVGDGLTHEVIQRLCRLRDVHVIAAGSAYALDAVGEPPEVAARRVAADYAVTGRWQTTRDGLSVDVQILEVGGARLVWNDRLSAGGSNAPLELIGPLSDLVVSAVERQIEIAEGHRVRLKPPGSLNAWEACHRGVWHMMRFTDADNRLARACFERAVALEPGYARPYAGLSFTHFQDAFLGWADRSEAVEAAYRAAAEGLAADEVDPSTHWALGRALWLRGQSTEALAALDDAIELSPNFAHAHYTRGFIHCQAGDPETAIQASDHSRRLSPYDPLLFAMLAARSLSLLRLGRHDEAAEWARKAIARPNAHIHILCIAAHVLWAGGRVEEARQVAARMQRATPGYGLPEFFRAFTLADDAERCFRQAARHLGTA